MEITCLLENTLLTADPDPDQIPGHAPDQVLNLAPAHGLSLHIRTGHTALVFDLGPDHRAMDNARHLGIDLSRVGTAVISHGHRDHGGGLAAFRRINPGAVILMSQGAAMERFFVRVPGAEARAIGLDYDREGVSGVRMVTGDERLSDGLSLFTGFGAGPFFPAGNATLFRQTQRGELTRDDFLHELALLVTDQDRTALFTGCSHSGIAHMVGTVMERSGLDHIDTVVGGFHLFNPSTGETEPDLGIADLARELDAFPRTRFYTGHCTGAAAFTALRRHLGDRLQPLSTGTRIHI